MRKISLTIVLARERTSQYVNSESARALWALFILLLLKVDEVKTLFPYPAAIIIIIIITRCMTEGRIFNHGLGIFSI